MLGLEGGELLSFAGPVVMAMVSHARYDFVSDGGISGGSLLD